MMHPRYIRIIFSIAFKVIFIKAQICFVLLLRSAGFVHSLRKWDCIGCIIRRPAGIASCP